MRTSMEFTKTSFAYYNEAVEDDFEDGACIHCFDVTNLVLDDLDFINHFTSLEFGNGCFEIATCEGKVICINYITFEENEFSQAFVTRVESFINEQMASYFFVTGTAYLH